MDGFTAKTLLEAAMSSKTVDDQNQVADLFKELNKDTKKLDPEVEKLVVSWIGKSCKIKFTGHQGIVLAANTSTGGFYPGHRFPVIVEITESTMKEAKGQVFEYGLDQVEIVE